jgi:DNA-binding Xre family transcriptional regulator
MTKKMGYRWLLRERMAEHGLWKTTDLAPLLADRGIHLSPAQIYRLVTHTPERLSLDVLAALCDVLGCGPGELIVPYIAQPAHRRAAGDEQLGDVTAIRDSIRPRRARVIDEP